MPTRSRHALPRNARSRLEWDSEFDGDESERRNVLHAFDVANGGDGRKTIVVEEEARWRKGGSVAVEPINAELVRQCLRQEGQQRAIGRLEAWRLLHAQSTQRLQRTLHLSPPGLDRQSPPIPVQHENELAISPLEPSSPVDNGPWQDMSFGSQPSHESPQPPTSPSTFLQPPRFLPTAPATPKKTAPEVAAPPESVPTGPNKVEIPNGKTHVSEELPAQSDLLPLSVQVAGIKPEQPPAPTSQEVAAAQYALYAAKAAQCREAFRELEREPSLKALKAAALFASSNPVTICSANSPMEIIEPYRKAFLLLRGARLETNSIPLALNDHPQLVHFVRYNMARKFIDVAALQTEEKNETKLLALAALLTELWACDAEFGEVFLALLYADCPSLVPVPYTLDANVEVYLRRLGALSKFYAAIMQTDRRLLLARLFPTKHFPGVNPHGAEAAWALLAHLVNGQVQVGITVLVLRNLLTMAGWLLAGTYGKQFSKLVALISRRMLPRIRQRTPAELLGPVERLADSLEDFHRLQTFPVPPRRLDQDFWSS